MKCSQILSFFLIPISLCAQTIDQIDELVKNINKTAFTDTVAMDSTSSYDLTRHKEKTILIFMSEDTVNKTIIRFSNSARIREVYYGPLEDYLQKVVYVKDTDSTNGKIVSEIYSWNEEILKSNIIEPLNDEEKDPFHILKSADHAIEIKFRLVDIKAVKFNFKGRLVEELPYPPGCGGFAFAMVHKFEVLSTDLAGYPAKYVLIIQPCPEFMGLRFFKKDHIYQIYAATNSGVTFGYSIENKYKKDHLPTFWSRKTTMIK